MQAKDEISRISAIVPEVIDGEAWYPVEAVARALRIDAEKAVRMLPGGWKRTIRRIMRNGIYNRTLIRREGVRALAIRYGRRPVHQAMAALREP